MIWEWPLISAPTSTKPITFARRRMTPKQVRVGSDNTDVIRGYLTNKVLEAEARFVDVETEEEVADDAW